MAATDPNPVGDSRDLLNPPEFERRPVELLHLASNSVHVLDGAASCWLVEQGEVSLFRVRVFEGAAIGSRRGLFDCHRGDLLFGDPGAQSVELCRFLAVAIGDCALRPLAPGDLAHLLRRDRARTLARLDKWVEKIAALFESGERVDAPASVGAASQSVSLMAGQSFQPRQRQVEWVRIDKGACTLNGMAEHSFLAGPHWLPLGGQMGLKAEGGAELTCCATEQVEAIEDILAGLGRLNASLLAFLVEEEERECLQESMRLAKRHSRERSATVEVLRDLRGVLDPPEAGAAVVEPGLMAALAILGERLGISFQSPGRSEDLARVHDPLDAVARASHIRQRQVLLRGIWWREDCGHLLGYLGRESPRPVALIREPGGYVVAEPGEERRPLDESLRRELSPQAVMFYRPFPDRALTLVDLPKFASRPFLSFAILGLALALAVALLGMITPQATRWLVDSAIPNAEVRSLIEVGVLLFVVNVIQAGLLLTQGQVTVRVQEGGAATVQAATLDRLFRLPVRFFQRYTSGDLLNRVMLVTEISQQISGTTTRSLLVGGLALLNFFLLCSYSLRLAMVALAIGLVVVG